MEIPRVEKSFKPCPSPKKETLRRPFHIHETFMSQLKTPLQRTTMSSAGQQGTSVRQLSCCILETIAFQLF